MVVEWRGGRVRGIEGWELGVGRWYRVALELHDCDQRKDGSVARDLGCWVEGLDSMIQWAWKTRMSFIVRPHTERSTQAGLQRSRKGPDLPIEHRETMLRST